jgi:hypothetical protein
MAMADDLLQKTARTARTAMRRMTSSAAFVSSLNAAGFYRALGSRFIASAHST